MATRFLVLRASVPLSEPFRQMGLLVPQAGAGAGFKDEAAPVDLEIEIAHGQAKDAGELREDPTSAAVLEADAMMSLIQPKSLVVESDPTLIRVGGLRMPPGLLATGVHSCPFTGQGVTAAVLDTGIDDSHPAFRDKEICKADFTGQGATAEDVADATGHGTHCAATLCGGIVDDIRVGVAPGISRLCVGKVVGTAGSTLEMLVRGMFWAVMEKRASVLSISLEYDLPGNAKRLIETGVDPALAVNAAMRQQRDIVKAISLLRMFLELRFHNVVFAAASGNESARPRFVLDAGLPAAELFAVGAAERVGEPSCGQWRVADFSNGRAQVVAPGVNVVSAGARGGWVAMSGTSVATPHVAGVAALWLEKLRKEGALFAPDVARSVVTTSATKRVLVDADASAVGAGMVQAPQ